ncbi:unnamed protein product [Urochloa humidicola]
MDSSDIHWELFRLSGAFCSVQRDCTLLLIKVPEILYLCSQSVFARMPIDLLVTSLVIGNKVLMVSELKLL